MIFPGGVAYLAGVFLAPLVDLFPLSVLGALLSFGFFLTWIEHRRLLTRQAGFLLFFCVVAGIVHAHWVAVETGQSDLMTLDQTSPVQLEGTIAAPVRHTPDGLILLVETHHLITQDFRQRIHGRLRLTWREPTDLAMAYGDKIRFTTRVRQPYGTLNPGGFHYGQYLQRQGVHGVAVVHGKNAITLLETDGGRSIAEVLGLVDRWRQRIHKAATTSLTNPALGLFLGMVIGDQGYIEPSIRDDFMVSGIVHILSISGSHLGLLSLVMFAGARWIFGLLPVYWLERVSMHLTATRFAVLTTIPAVSMYTLLAGAEMATVRSWIMLMVCCVGIWLGRERHLITALAMAALFMVLPNPSALHDLSFQLSYLSVSAIALVLFIWKERESSLSEFDVRVPSPQPTRLVRVWRKIQLAALVTCGISLVTLPLVASHFHHIPWMGIFTNMIIVPLVGIVMIPIGLTSAILVLVNGETVLPFAVVNQWMFDGLVDVVSALAQVPGAAWYVASPGFGLMVLYYGLLIVVVKLWRNTAIRFGCITLLAGILLWWIWSPRTGWEPGSLRVTFLDVGQGDATVLELPDGQTILIDAGPAYRRVDMGRAVIGPFLWNRGIRRLDHVIATHPQWDHVGGLPWVLQTFDVGRYWSNGLLRSEDFYERLQVSVKRAGLEEQVGSEGTSIVNEGPCSLSVLSPSPVSPPTSRVLSGKHLNNRSLVTRLECGTHTFLFTADAEYEALSVLLRTFNGRSARVVKVPHHGAKSSLHREWVNALEAEAMVVSVGPFNRYGHPAKEVIAAYLQRGLSLYRTDQEGAIWFTATLDSHDMTISTAKQEKLLPVQAGPFMWEEEKNNWIRIMKR